ncbi:TraR/DksA family transcriptional regulator [Arthrobacter castelli]|uniref:TraR/DksA family transcriptional regulator n=1 Tax=Arthrobacter castelli TaxID=271431 RepID=UPI00040762B6|nr:TraR/DksA C4-type zinc finger protein [Arthrobacter castelli]
MNVDTERRFRALLESERAERQALISSLQKDIAAVGEARQDSNVDDEHDPEGSTIAFELSQASTLLADSSNRLKEIDAALQRLDDGTYGICAVCGEPIPEGRLEIRPWTHYCVRHASSAIP